MGTLEEIKDLENQMIQAELGPDPDFFQRVLHDEALLDGAKAKEKVVWAHTPGSVPKFTKVEMSDLKIIDHGDAAVVTVTGFYQNDKWSGSLKFLRVWKKFDSGWKIIAGTTENLKKGDS